MTFVLRLSRWLGLDLCVVGMAATLAAGCAGEKLTDPSDSTNPVKTVAINPTTVSVAVNDVVQLSVTLRDSRGAPVSGRPVTWTSDAEGVATVSGAGLVQGAATGSATIRAESEGIAATAVVTVSAAQATASGSCLLRAGSTIKLSGSPAPYINGSMASNTGIDARSASWTGTSTMTVRYEGGSSVCWSGGRITGLFPDGTSWSAYHDAYSMVIRKSPGTVIEGVRVHNYGDGPNFDAVGSDGWTVRGNHLSYMHDDCISNDFGNSGLVDDNLMDGCYMGYSSRAYAGFVANNRSKVVTFRGNLIRLQDMPTGYAGPGHAKFWKMNSTDGSGNDPRLALHNNIFRMDTPADCCGSFLIPPAAYLKECSNNVIVWLGAGEFPEPVPSCFRVTRDKSVWDNAVANWKSRHPHVAS